jgi:DDE family transposase
MECALVFKSGYHLNLRAAHGFLSSVMELRRLTLPIPDYSTVSRRQTALAIRSALTPSSTPRHVVVDATGLKVYGVGAWRVRKHRLSRRRTWRKLHVGINEKTREIVAVAVTESRVHDSRPLPALLAQMADPIAHVSGDGAYDTRVCHEAVLKRRAIPTFAPRRPAKLDCAPHPTAWRTARNHILEQIAAHGRSTWRVRSGCPHQSIAENTMVRFKQVFGVRL